MNNFSSSQLSPFLFLCLCNCLVTHIAFFYLNSLQNPKIAVLELNGRPLVQNE